MEATLQSPVGQINLEPGVVTIGSTPDSRVVLHDARVSPHHAIVHSTEQGHTITDQWSTEGTFVNDKRLEPFVPHLLMAGDRIRIGETVFTYEVHEGPALAQARGSRAGDEPTVLATPSKPSEYTTYGAESSSVPTAQTLYGPALQQEYTPAPAQQPGYVVPQPARTQPTTAKQPEQPSQHPKLIRRYLVISVIAVIVLGGVLTAALMLSRGSSAQSAFSAYCNAVVKKDYTTAYGLLSDDLKKDLTQTEYAAEEQTIQTLPTPFNATPYPTGCKIDSLTVNSSTASATVYYSSGQSPVVSGEITGSGTVTDPAGRSFSYYVIVTPEGVGFNLSAQQINGTWKITKIEFS